MSFCCAEQLFCVSLRWCMSAWLMLTLYVFAAMPAFASESLHLSGFGTLGYARDNRSDMSPLRDVTQNIVSGSSSSDWNLDSRLGVQLEYNLSPTADLVGQVVLRDKYRDDFNKSTMLAYVGIRPQPTMDLRLGRISYDVFLMSEYRDVGYAQPWARPPAEFYGWLPVFFINGMDAAYSIHGDAANWRIKAQAGGSKSSMPIGRAGYEFSSNNLLGASISRQTESLRIKAAFSQFTIGTEVPAFASLHQGLDAVTAAAIPGVSAEAADLRNNLTFRNAKITYTTLGAAFDDGEWVAQGEVGYSTSTAAVVPNGRMAYLSVGHNFGDWTPFVLLSATRPGNGVRSAANDWGAFNATLLNPALTVLNGTRNEQNTASVGTSWRVHRNATFKFQLDSTSIRPSGYGLWWHAGTSSQQSARVNLISTTLDFTF